MRTVDRLLPLVATLAAASACQGPQGPTSPGTPDPPPIQLVVMPASPTPAANGQADVEQFEVCKYGSSAEFGFSVTDHTNNEQVTTGTFALADGQCLVVAQFGFQGADVTVTETGAQSGFHFDRAVVTTIAGAFPCSTTTTSTATQSSPTVTGSISGSKGDGTCEGVLAEYYNVVDQGGQGCTPGYWKQPQHFDSWPAGIRPTDLFSTYFENAYPGMTLLDVLTNNGNASGLEALGRHTVAAFLNANSSDVSFAFTSAQVVGAFDAAYPGTKTAYNALKGRLSTANEAGCPLD